MRQFLIEGLILSDMIFFDPSPEFMPWLLKFSNHRKVIDMGAGVGNLTVLLRQNGFKVLPVDICQRENPVCEIAPLDASEMTIPKLSCRAIVDGRADLPLHRQQVRSGLPEQDKNKAAVYLPRIARSANKNLPRTRLHRSADRCSME